MSRITTVLAAIALLSACAGTDGLISSELDLSTGVTVTYNQSPLVFYRDDSGKAAYARNMVHLGPIEVNRSGAFRYYLWLGIWSTVEEPYNAPTRDGFESITIFVDGEPLSLDVLGWTAAAIGASHPPYTKPVASAADAYYEVTVDQLRLLALATDIRIQSTGSKPRVYELWNEQTQGKASLVEFLRQSIY